LGANDNIKTIQLIYEAFGSGDLNAILEHVAQMNELDTSQVIPMAQVTEILGGIQARELRPDAVVPSLDREHVMACAPETDGTFFKVPKVIER